MNGRVADFPPEYCQYQDCGCEFGRSCLNCPLPLCVHDEPGGSVQLRKQRRAREMARLHVSEGKSVKEIAAVYGVSTRTVQRALKTVNSFDPVRGR